MSTLRKIAATGLVSLTLALGSLATVTPALAHGGGGHGGGGHGGGSHAAGEHAGRMGMGRFAGEEYRGGAFFRHDRFDGRFRDRGPVFFGSNDDYDRCQWQWVAAPDGHTIRDEICY